ncbi:MAG TPA: DUF4340 domain-containing protein [Planctomycetota bacterium]|nr:DUF4340 domain-containing protein [Planctomycetota bacterium]
MIKPSVILALLVLLVLMAVGIFVYQGDRPSIKPVEKVGSPVLKDAKLTNVTAIDIKKGDVAVRLEQKAEKQWIVASHNGRPAKLDRIDQLVLDVGQAKIESTREGKPETFGLDEKSQAQVHVTSGGEKYSLIVGKSPDYSKAFVKTDAAGPIYEVDKGLDMSIGVRTDKDERVLDPTYFYDLKLISVPVDDIIDITVTKGKDTVRVRRAIVDKELIEPKTEVAKDAKLEWRIVEPSQQPADDGAVGRITNQFIAMNFKKYVEGVSDKDAGLDNPSAKVAIKTKDGAEHVLTFGKIDGEDVYLSINGRSDKFMIYKFTFDQVALTLDDLKKKEPPKANVEEPKPLPAPDNQKNLTQEEKDKIRKEVEAQMPKAPEPKPKADAPPPPPPVAPEPEQKAPPAVIKDDAEKK